jgi:hypothetical protein
MCRSEDRASLRTSTHPTLVPTACCKDRLRPFPVFVLFRPVICRAPGGARVTSSPVSCVHPGAYGESIGAGLYPASCFFLSFTGKYREIQGNTGKRHLFRRRTNLLSLETHQLGARDGYRCAPSILRLKASVARACVVPHGVLKPCKLTRP